VSQLHEMDSKAAMRSFDANPAPTMMDNVYEIEAQRAANTVLRHWPAYLHNAEGTSVNSNAKERSFGTAGGFGSDARDRPVLSAMEASFGRDFSNVRIHRGAESTERSAALGAKAFTIGNDIFFGKGQYRPDTPAGIHLLAHELAHVAQQQSKLPTNRNALVPIFLQSPRAVACQPLDEAEEDAAYRRDEAEDKRPRKREPRRGADPKPLTGGQASREAERKIGLMIEQARRGDYRHMNTSHRQQETNRFRALLRQYKSSELARLDAQIAKTPKGTARTWLMIQKWAIKVQRSSWMGQFDEAMRTPANARAQRTYTNPSPAPNGTRRTSASARPDYTLVITDRNGQRTVAHFNLKSHDLRDKSPKDAKKVAQEIVRQAKRNAQHLPPRELIVISFIDQPSPAVQEEMKAALFQKGSPINAVRFGTVTHYNNGHTAPTIPPGRGTLPSPSTSGSAPPTKGPAKIAAILPVDVHGASVGKSIPTHSSSPTPPSVQPRALGPHSPVKQQTFNAGSARATYTSEGFGGKVRVDVMMSQYPEPPKAAGTQKPSRLGPAVSIAQTGQTLLDLFSEGADEGTKDAVGWVTHPIRSYFQSQLADAERQFLLEFPSADSFAAVVDLAEKQEAYERAWASQSYLKEAARAWLLMSLALTPDHMQDERWLDLVEQAKKPLMVRPADRRRAQEASYLYMDAMADAEIPMSERMEALKLISSDVSMRAVLLYKIHSDLSKIYWDIISTIPLAYYFLGSLDVAIALFGDLAARMANFAAFVAKRRDEYQQAIDTYYELHLRATNLKSISKRGGKWIDHP
jgi:hypothetical protein